jgi:L-amino acid N-acyltransferase YncA
VSIDIKLEFDTIDAILLVTTGGLGYLARAAYRHFDGKSARDIETQRRNLFTVMDEAKNKGIRRMVVRINPDVPYYEPENASIICHEWPGYKELEITFDQ